MQRPLLVLSALSAFLVGLVVHRRGRPHATGAGRGSVSLPPERRATPAAAGTGAPTRPQPEQQEPRLSDPGLSELSRRDWRAVIVRGAKETIADNAPNLAKAIAYNAFIAIPSALLVVLGVFGLVASPSDIKGLMAHLRGIVPASGINLIADSLQRVTTNQSGSVVMVLVGFLLALWSVLGAMQTVMWALNTAFERTETRGFVRTRMAALGMAAAAVVAVAALFGLLVLGPTMSGWVGTALGHPGLVTWVWWIAQWPLLVAVLLGGFAAILYLGPDVELPRWRFITPGAVTAVTTWLVISAGFALYTSAFSSYNKAWGSLAAVIIMLTWLWLSALALLFGAEINAEAERSRELRQGQAAEVALAAPSKR